MLFQKFRNILIYLSHLEIIRNVKKGNMYKLMMQAFDDMHNLFGFKAF